MVVNIHKKADNSDGYKPGIMVWLLKIQFICCLAMREVK